MMQWSTVVVGRRKALSGIRVVAIAVSLTLGALGCAPNTTKDLRDSVTPYIFTANDPYDRVYEHLVYQMVGCMTKSFLAMHMFVQNQFLEEQGYGEVILRSTNMGDRSVWLYVKVYDQGPDEAKVEVWETEFGVWGTVKYTIKGWLVEGETECHAF